MKKKILFSLLLLLIIPIANAESTIINEIDSKGFYKNKYNIIISEENYNKIKGLMTDEQI